MQRSQKALFSIRQPEKTLGSHHRQQRIGVLVQKFSLGGNEIMCLGERRSGLNQAQHIERNALFEFEL